MLEKTTQAIREILDNQELLPLMARAIRKYYEALLKEGFSEEQATIIVANTFGIQSKQ